MGALDVLAADGAEHEGVLSAGRLGVRGGVHLDGAERSGALGGSDARGRPLEDASRAAPARTVKADLAVTPSAPTTATMVSRVSGVVKKLLGDGALETRRGLCLGRGHGEALSKQQQDILRNELRLGTQSHWLACRDCAIYRNRKLFHHTEVRRVEILGWRSPNSFLWSVLFSHDGAEESGGAVPVSSSTSERAKRHREDIFEDGGDVAAKQTRFVA